MLEETTDEEQSRIRESKHEQVVEKNCVVWCSFFPNPNELFSNEFDSFTIIA